MFKIQLSEKLLMLLYTDKTNLCLLCHESAKLLTSQLADQKVFHIYR